MSKMESDKEFALEARVKTLNNKYKPDKFSIHKEIGKNYFLNWKVDDWSKFSRCTVDVNTIERLGMRLHIFMDGEEDKRHSEELS